MKILTRRRALLALIFAVGVALRAYHLESVPAHNETIDEYAWAWSGMTLWREGAPRAWSYLPMYKAQPWVKWRDWGYKVVKPWLDHPPLFSMVMGAWMVAGGYRDIFTVELRWMRWLPWMLFLVSFWLVHRLMRHYLDEDEVLMGMALYATAPLVAIDHKLVICENFLVPVASATQLALLKFSEARRRRDLLLVGLGAAALPFSKVAALGMSLYFLTLAAMRRDRALFLTVAGGTALGVGLYVLWGWHYDWGQFREVLRCQAARFNGFEGAFELLFAHKMVGKKFIYYPFFLGTFVALGAILDGKGREYFLQYPIYIGALIFFVDQNQVYGWYLIPMYPVLCAGTAQFAVKMLRQPDARWLFVWALFVLPYAGFMIMSQGADPRRFLGQLRYLYIFLLVGALATAWVFVGRRRLYTIAAAALVGLLFLVDVQYLIRR